MNLDFFNWSIYCVIAYNLLCDGLLNAGASRRRFEASFAQEAFLAKELGEEGFLSNPNLLRPGSLPIQQTA